MSGRFEPAFDVSYINGVFPPAFDTIGVLPPIVQRYFTDLTAAGGQYIGNWSSNPQVSRIAFDVNSPTGSTVGLPTGTPAITANQLQRVDFSFSGALPDFGRNGASFFDGDIANIQAWDISDNLIVDVPVDEDWTTGNVARNRAAVLGSELYGSTDSLPAAAGGATSLDTGVSATDGETYLIQISYSNVVGDVSLRTGSGGTETISPVISGTGELNYLHTSQSSDTFEYIGRFGGCHKWLSYYKHQTNPILNPIRHSS